MDNVTTPEALLTFEESLRELGAGSNQDPDHILKCYQLALWAATENDELTSKLENRLAFAWRVSNQHDVVQQITKDGKFVLDIQFNEIEGVQTCDACKGAGERFKFAKKPIEVGCLKCKDVLINHNGKDLIITGDIITLGGEDVSENPDFKKYIGKVVEDCISCNGTGRYKREMEDDLIINVKCKTCHGHNIDGKSETTQIITKCKTCKGKRRIKIPVISAEIKSTTICRKCSGKGFIKPKPESQPMNPVISPDLGSAIKGL